MDFVDIALAADILRDAKRDLTTNERCALLLEAMPGLRTWKGAVELEGEAIVLLRVREAAKR